MSTQVKLFGNNPKYERWRWQIFGITWLAYTSFYLTRKAFSVAKIGIDQDPTIQLTESEMAWIDMGYLTAYAVGQFIWGMAGDRVGTRKVVLVGMFASVLTAVGMGASSLTIALGVFFCIQGLCQSTGWAPLTKNIGAFFSQRERGVVMGLWCTNYAVGGMIASVYAGYVGDVFGWRYAFFIPAATLLGCWLLFVLLQRDRPEDVGLPPIEQYHGEAEAVLVEGEKPEEEPPYSWKVVFNVITNRMVILLALVYLLLKPTRYAILFWGPKYINYKLGSGMAESGLISAMFELAGPLSAFAGGVVSDKVFGSKRMPVSVVCLLLLGVLLLFLDDLPATRLALCGGFFLVGFLVYAPDSLVSGTAAIDFGTKKGASTAAGLINGFGSIGAIVGGTIPGFFAEKWGWGGVFSFLAGMVFLAGLALLPKWNALPPSVKNSPRAS